MNIQFPITHLMSKDFLASSVCQTPIKIELSDDIRFILKTEAGCYIIHKTTNFKVLIGRSSICPESQ